MPYTPKKRIRKWDNSPERKKYDQQYRQEWKKLLLKAEIHQAIDETATNLGVPKNHLATAILEEWLNQYPDMESRAAWATNKRIKS